MSEAEFEAFARDTRAWMQGAEQHRRAHEERHNTIDERMEALGKSQTLVLSKLSANNAATDQVLHIVRGAQTVRRLVMWLGGLAGGIVGVIEFFNRIG